MTRDLVDFCLLGSYSSERRGGAPSDGEPGQHYERSILRIYDVTDVKDFKGANANSYLDIS